LAFDPEAMVKKLSDLTSALTDERYHDNVGFCTPRNSAEQRAFPDTRPGKESHALAFTEREQPVDGTNSCRHHARNRRPGERWRRRRVDGHVHPSLNLATTIDGAPEAIDDAAQQRLGRPDLEGCARRLDLIAWTDARKRPKRHRNRFPADKAHDLGHQRLPTLRYPDDITHAYARHRESKGKSRHARDATGDAQGLGLRKLLPNGVSIDHRPTVSARRQR
jgi:hypothetical protein